MDLQTSVPGVGDARAAVLQHERRTYRANMAVGTVAHALTQGRLPDVVVGIDEGQVIYVSEEAVNGAG